MGIKLYSWPRSSGTRVAWALEELGAPYEYVELDPKKHEHRSPKYLVVNPHGKVPALVDGDQTFFESGAILLHLGNKYGVEKNLWPAGGGQARADAISWTVWAMTELGPYMLQYLLVPAETTASLARDHPVGLDNLVAAHPAVKSGPRHPDLTRGRRNLPLVLREDGDQPFTFLIGDGPEIVQSTACTPISAGRPG